MRLFGARSDAAAISRCALHQMAIVLKSPHIWRENWAANKVWIEPRQVLLDTSAGRVTFFPTAFSSEGVRVTSNWPTLNNARQILADAVRTSLITSPDVSTHLRPG